MLTKPILGRAASPVEMPAVESAAEPPTGAAAVKTGCFQVSRSVEFACGTDFAGPVVRLGQEAYARVGGFFKMKPSDDNRRLRKQETPPVERIAGR